jgi:hypothetical protein
LHFLSRRYVKNKTIDISVKLTKQKRYFESPSISSIANGYSNIIPAMNTVLIIRNREVATLRIQISAFIARGDSFSKNSNLSPKNPTDTNL